MLFCTRFFVLLSPGKRHDGHAAYVKNPCKGPDSIIIITYIPTFVANLLIVVDISLKKIKVRMLSLFCASRLLSELFLNAG